MAEETDDATQAHDGEGPHEPQPCMPCRGSGKVISGLGGTQRKVTCPWCQGSGERIVGADAQEYREQQARKHVG
jgi:DnaJ-class molecular chaperone